MTSHGLPAVSDQKNALIDAMEKRIKGHSLMSAQEILSSAGISNHRVTQALDHI